MTERAGDMAAHDDVQTLAALYASGALPPEEAAEVEARIEAGDTALAEAVRSFETTVEALVENSPAIEPDPRIKASLLARIGEAPKPSTSFSSSHAEGAVWQPVVMDGVTWPGVTARMLHLDPRRGRLTALLRVEPGGSIPEHVHDQDEECYVLEGDLSFDDKTYVAGDYFLAPAGTLHAEQTTKNGCVCLVSTGLANTYT